MPLVLPPGVRRDGGFIESDPICTDALWIRFDRGKPRKIKGYQEIINSLSSQVRGIYVSDKRGYTNVYFGEANHLEYTQVDRNSVTGALVDRTPSVFFPSSDNLWQFDQLFSPSSNASVVLAHPGLNLSDITSELITPVYYGFEPDTAPLTALTVPSEDGSSTGVSGGIVVLHPYLFFYGAGGYLNWSAPGDPTTTDTASGGGGTGARICESKVVKGLPYRGGQSGPAGIFWSLNSVDLVTFAGGTQIFQNSIISDDTTILSSQTPLEYDGAFYWVADGRFLRYAGVVQEVPNLRNIDFFFDNLTPRTEQRIFSFKIPRRGEVWFCGCLNGAPEPNHAVIYNVRIQDWYDTPITPRTAGTMAKVARKPYLVAAQSNPDGRYSLWQHETGVDELKLNGSRNAIRSYFQTGSFSPVLQGRNNATQAVVLEPDFKVQQGHIDVTVTGRNALRGPDIDGKITIVAEQDELVPMEDSRRYMRLRIESNTAGGDLELGTPTLHQRDDLSRIGS
jgi:hypothetical protein